jgi:GNAT superfamily N-acetyltransferase
MRHAVFVNHARPSRRARPRIRQTHMTAFTLRPALVEEAEALARIHCDGRDAIPLPTSRRTSEDVTAYHARLIATIDVRVAAGAGGGPIAYAARDGDLLTQLYVAPAHFRAGAGAALLAAMRRESALTLWCFAHNARALAFYRHFGAVEIGRELGPENEEGMPAIQLALTRL